MNKIFINKKGFATYVGVLIPFGSYYENSKFKGVAHFIEHMMFKATKNRTKKEINNTIEAVGGDLNAYTCEEQTFYHAIVANQYKDMAIDVIQDIALNPTFPAKEIDKEREVIVQELKMYEDNPSALVGELYNKIYYPKESGFHLPVIGTKETLYKINREVLKNYHKINYQNPTLIVIGDVKNKINKEEVLMKTTSNIIYKQKHSEYLEKRKVEQAHIIIGHDVYLPQYSKIDTILLLNLLKLLLNGMSGRLFGKIREENNLVYGIHFNYTVWSGGMITWYVNLGLDKAKIYKARKLIEQEMTKNVLKKELEETITKTIGTNALESEDINTISELIVDCTRKQIDYRPLYHDFEKELRRVSGNLNEFIKALNFKENLMVGIVPK
jgi:predicted Zn-dependent peptidase